MEQAFIYWQIIFLRVLQMLMGNVTTAMIFGMLVVKILVSVVGTVFNRDGTKKEG